MEFGIYVVIVGAIVWGLPTFLAWKFHTEYPIAAITSGSMWPVLKTGDLVLVKAVEREDLKIGDIVVWKNPIGFTIHRIVKLDKDTITTKGDANFTQDKPTPYENVVGKNVTWGNGNPIRIPYLGFISMWSSQIKETYAGTSN